MTAAAAISGSFADYRLVKSRSVLQLVIEIPVEGQAAAFEALGYPMPGVEIPVAIARLTEPACAPQRERPAAPPSLQAGGGATSTKTPAERAVQQAGKLPRDPRFLAWAQTRLLHHTDDPVPNVFTDMDAVNFIRAECCDGNSRSLIAEVPEYMDRFMEMLTAFQIDVGELPEPR